MYFLRWDTMLIIHWSHWNILRTNSWSNSEKICAAGYGIDMYQKNVLFCQIVKEKIHGSESK